MIDYDLVFTVYEGNMKSRTVLFSGHGNDPVKVSLLETSTKMDANDNLISARATIKIEAMKTKEENAND